MHLRSLARSHIATAIATLAGIAQNGESETARVLAADKLLDRGWGRAPQAITGAEGEGSIQVIIRHILEGRDEVLDAKVIDATLVQHRGGDKD